ncbi:DUF402 domain-containing protein [Paludifilum halophilum]|nr:DUF402 domain-containing protein [Paludifilum halophilum]
MDFPKPGDILRIESYKHDGTLHRTWKRSVVLDGSDSLLLANKDVEVMEADGRRWISEGLAVCQFHRKHWFNTILLFGSEGFHRYYCNIASPYRYENGKLVYIDYDLDLIADKHGYYRWMDTDEFEKNRCRMNYPIEVLDRVEEAVSELERRVRTCTHPFHPDFVQAGYYLFLTYAKQLMG